MTNKKLTPVEICYNEEETQIFEKFFVDKHGIKQGEYICYYENGKPELVENYNDGELHGKWTEYYENGNTRIKGNYKDGKEDGKWTEYYENGSIELVENCKNGEGHGKWTWYDEDGKPEREQNYKDRNIGLLEQLFINLKSIWR